MKKAILTVTMVLIPSLATASGFVFASPKKEPYIKPGVQKVSRTSKGSATKKKACDPSYPTVCLSPGAPDLNCRDIGFANFPVVGRDPHGFDRDGDGVGCEARMQR
jgi:hypothetical protein